MPTNTDLLKFVAQHNNKTQVKTLRCAPEPTVTINQKFLQLQLGRCRGLAVGRGEPKTLSKPPPSGAKWNVRVCLDDVTCSGTLPYVRSSGVESDLKNWANDAESSLSLSLSLRSSAGFQNRNFCLSRSIRSSTVSDRLHSFSSTPSFVSDAFLSYRRRSFVTCDDLRTWRSRYVTAFAVLACDGQQLCYQQSGGYRRDAGGGP